MVFVNDAPYLLLTQADGDMRADGLMSYCSGSNLDGPFVEWCWDGHTLHIANDCYGFFPSYYVIRDNMFAISTSMSALMALVGAVEWDDVGLAAFLRLGYFLGDRTAIRDIRVLPPSASVDWTSGRPVVIGRRIAVRQNHCTRSHAIEQYIALFSEAIQKRLPERPFAVPLSSGRDSRHILLELVSLGYRPDYCITARTNDQEVHIAATVAEALQLEHHVVEPPASAFHAETCKNHLTHFSTMEHSWLLPMVDVLDGKVSTIYDGLAGDVLSAGSFLTKERLEAFAASGPSGLAEVLMPLGATEALLRRMLTPHLYARFNRDAALAELTQEISRHVDSPNPVGAFFFANRTRRAVALSPLCIFRQVGRVICPYLDTELYEFLAALPADMLHDFAFHTETIYAAYPRFANIPFETKSIYAAHVRHPALDRSTVTQREPTDKAATAVLYRRWRRFAVELFGYAYAGGLRCGMPCGVRARFLVPRVLRTLLDRGYAAHESRFLLPVCYLIQLERTCRQASAEHALQ